MAIEDEVLKAIESGKAKMHPKSYFVFRNAAGILLAVIVLLLVVYLASFVWFALHESGVWYEPQFGAAGWSAFFASLPWALIALIAILFVALAVIMLRYPLAYRWPIVYSLVGLICLVAVGNLLIAGTSLQAEVFSRGVDERVPLIGDYYGGFAVPADNDIHRGYVLTTASSGFIMADLYGATSAVVLASETYLPPSPSFAPGAEVVVFGDRNGSGTINALGVREISPCAGCSTK